MHSKSMGCSMTIIRDAVIRLRLEQEKTQLENPAVSGVSKAYEDIQKAAAEAAASIREAINASKEWGRESPRQQTELSDLAAAIREALAAAKEWGKEVPKQAPAIDAWTEGLRRLNEEWRKSGSGRDSWGEGLARMKEQQKAAKEAAAAMQEYAGGAQAHWSSTAQVAETSSRRMVNSFREGGEGALRFARGLAFLSASGSEDIQKLARTVSVAQGAFDVFAGGTKMVMNMTAALGPWGAAIAAGTAVLAAGALAISHYNNKQKEAAEYARKWADEQKKINAELGRTVGGALGRTADFDQQTRDRQLRAAGAGTSSQQRAALDALVPEFDRKIKNSQELLAERYVKAQRSQDAEVVQNTLGFARGGRNEVESRIQLEERRQQLALEDINRREQQAQEALRSAAGFGRMLGFDISAPSGSLPQFDQERERTQQQFGQRIKDLNDIGQKIDNAIYTLVEKVNKIEAAAGQ
jgi:hypothetical protein